MAGSIRRLDKAVVDRIAAGEVVHRPASALKELLENAIDAGATAVSVVLVDGGLKRLQITDNGSGIALADFPILCERFTTSKLSSFSDLGKIQTFGFRGEALASITHVSHVTVTSKTADTACAYKASFEDGNMQGEAPTPCAGTQGTQIVSEDLFYNMPMRRKAVKNASQEHRKCIEVVSHYALHYPHIAFTLKKGGAPTTDVHTASNSTHKDVLGRLFGAETAREALEFKGACQGVELGGLATNANYSAKRPQVVLFINNRLVQCASIRKTIDNVYAKYLPKGAHPFVYLWVKMRAQDVDVNVHPTKKEVHFLHEDALNDELERALETALKGSNESRAYKVVVMKPLPSAGGTAGAAPASSSSSAAAGGGGGGGGGSSATPKKMPAHKATKRVRVDSNTTSLHDFLLHGAGPPHHKKQKTKKKTHQQEDDEAKGVPRLASVQALLDGKTSDMLAKHVFVGAVNDDFALVQHRTRLLLVETAKARTALFEWRILTRFGRVPKRKLEPPLAMSALVAMEEEEEEEEDVEARRRGVCELLLEKRELLHEYFSLDLSPDGYVQAIPDGLAPGALPQLLVRLAVSVEWATEDRCLAGIARIISQGAEALPTTDLFRALRQERVLVDEKEVGAVSIATLENLYKIFERC